MTLQATGRNDTEETPRGGARVWRRLAPLAGLAIVLVLVLAGCGEQQPYSTLNPATEKAEDIHWLYQLIFWAALFVFVGVQIALAYIVLKFRRRGDTRPPQIHGSRVLEIAWTIIPAVLLLAVFIPTAQTIFKHAAAEQTADFEIDVLGKQWWWEIQYPGIPANENDPSAGNVVTANEVMLPLGANVVFNLRSNNVIHSFWVPQLSGKTDVMPGHNNQLQFTASTLGNFYGECAEFCGASHAWMRFKVKVVPVAEFDRWIEAYRTPPAGTPNDQGVVPVPSAFGVCLVCHRINGTNAVIAQEGLASNPLGVAAGPNLSLVGCRDTIGAGILKNTPENLARWIKETDKVKDGVYMPNYYSAGQINDQQVDELVTYLESLKPEGGCPATQPVGGDEQFVSAQQTTP